MTRLEYIKAQGQARVKVAAAAGGGPIRLLRLMQEAFVVPQGKPHNADHQLSQNQKI